MKKIIPFCLILLIGCSTKKKDIILLGRVSQFKMVSENKLLCTSLIYHDYLSYFKIKYPFLTSYDLQSISLSFLDEPDSIFSLKLTLDNLDENKKELAINFYKYEIEKQIAFFKNNQKLVKDIIEFARINLSYLDSYDYKSFWSNTDNKWQESTTYDIFINSIKNRDELLEGKSRKFRNIEYYDYNFDKSEKDIIAIYFTNGFSNKKVEKVSLKLSDSNLKYKLIGYDILIK